MGLNYAGIKRSTVPIASLTFFFLSNCTITYPSTYARFSSCIYSASYVPKPGYQNPANRNVGNPSSRSALQARSPSPIVHPFPGALVLKPLVFVLACSLGASSVLNRVRPGFLPLLPIGPYIRTNSKKLHPAGSKDRRPLDTVCTASCSLTSWVLYKPCRMYCMYMYTTHRYCGT